MQPILIAASSILAFISPVVYAVSIFKGEAKPHRTTRLVLLLITSLTTASLFAQHNRVAIWLAAVSTLQSVLIFALSIRFGMGGWSKGDILCLAIALAGIILWKITADPVLALYFAIGADFTGMIPALRKTYRFPETEVWTFYGLDVAASALSLAAVAAFRAEEISYPFYVMAINTAMVILILRKRMPSLFREKRSG